MDIGPFWTKFGVLSVMHHMILYCDHVIHVRVKCMPWLSRPFSRPSRHWQELTKPTLKNNSQVGSLHISVRGALCVGKKGLLLLLRNPSGFRVHVVLHSITELTKEGGHRTSGRRGRRIRAAGLSSTKKKYFRVRWPEMG